ncbi:Thioredoxin family protein [Synechococcus sp. WH 8101]|uniref:thylakoid membrane photosystem I accumulation factor n=1 Tax=Synechococcus sp. WH 8101 TaxID=59932 RepID=UPI001022B244|nr:thylakoid membrane photosystem I accumulation factor [Synechococcus sp. WH 8101]QBE69155.1 Thioredoxin family protein [Synechococcus sp. WH 8101]QNI45388.1 thioredoxin-like regulatory factor of photosystem I titer [Synechococcus sp. WH 8101]
MARLLQALLSVCLAFLLIVPPAQAGRDDDAYDGNIFALYAGNGSLVPPATSLDDALAAGRTSVLVFYLDDSRTSKAFAPSVSELQRLWTRNIDLMPLTTDALQDRVDQGPTDPAHYWGGHIPQVVVIDGAGSVLLDATGQVPLDRINAAISKATGLPAPEGSSTSLSFNELNTEIQTR